MDLIGNISDSTLFIHGSAQRLALLGETNPARSAELIEEIKGYRSEIDDYVADLEKYNQKETAMQDFVQIWQGYRQRIDRLDSTQASKEALAEYAASQRASIWDLMNTGYDTYLEEAYRYDEYSRYLQILTLLGLLAYLAFLIGYALKRMRRLDAQIDTARAQTAQILGMVSEGLFLVDKNLVIADQYSAQLTKIIPKKNKSQVAT